VVIDRIRALRASGVSRRAIAGVLFEPRAFKAGRAAEHDRGTYPVWLLPDDHVAVGHDRWSAESRVSFKDAIDRLARKVPPEVPLPWSRGR
jgi:hypothetical protein